MMGPAWFALGLVMALCSGGAISQFVPDTSMISFDMYLQTMTFSAKDDLKDKTSQIYAEMKAKVEEVFQPLGGTLEDVIFSDGGGCVKIFVNWRNGDQNAVMGVMDTLRKDGFMIWGETWTVSFTSCGAAAEVHMLRFKFYVVDMPWSENMESQGTTEYNQLMMIVKDSFSGLGGSMRTLKIAKNNGCVEFYVEWDAMNPTNILSLMETLKTSGVTVMGVNYKIQTKPCLPPPAEVDECPKVPSGVFGACVELCDDADPAMKCPEGFKCCSNGCGHACARVGYTLKINATVIIDLPWMDGMDSEQGTMFSQVEATAKQMIEEVFNLAAEPLVVGVELKKISKYNYQARTVAMLHVVMYLSKDPENSALLDSADLMNQMSAMVGTTQISILSVLLGNNTMCGGIECAGICKELRSGLQYCSCHPGYVGPDCASMDCRSDLTQFPGVGNNQCTNGGTCVRLDDASGFECDCQKGFYGSLCKVRLCDLLSNPCSGQGTCVGDVNNGQICECNANRGGLFCEESLQVARENLTLCQRQRRLMEFVHAQVRGEQMSPMLTLPMSQVLSQMGEDEYSMPYCYPVGSGRDGEYYSMCMYNAVTAKKGECFCVSADAMRNYWYYFGEDDCRVFSGTFVPLEWDFFIHGITWSDSFLDEESDSYMEVKQQIVETMSPLGGLLTRLDFKNNSGCVAAHLTWNAERGDISKETTMRLMEMNFTVNGQAARISTEPCATLAELHMLQVKFYVVGMPWSENLRSQTSTDYQELKMLVGQYFSDLGGEMRTLEMEQNNGCVEFYVEWNTEHPENILTLMGNLKTSGVTVKNQNYKIQTKPCLPSAAEVDECPSVSSDQVGICIQACDDNDPSMKCPEGFKCCSNGCGHVCARVGYTVKINTTVVIDAPWIDGMDKKDGVLFSQIQTLAKQMITEAFNLGAETSVVDVELISISKKDYKGMMLPLPVLSVVIYFSKDPENSMLQESRDRLMQMTISLNGMSSSVKSVMLGTAMSKTCDGIECDGICKELRSGLQYCSCNSGYVGPDCASIDCRADMSRLPQADNNQCVNGGECATVRSDSGAATGFQCQCQPGYFGALCQVRLCDLLTNPCNNQDTCVGDVNKGMICECNAYRGGLMCENAIQTARENLTMCEQQRRLMEFVHAQVRGDPQADMLTLPMPQILSKMEMEDYAVPYCSAQDRSFYSMCTYHSMDGSKDDCYCVGSNGMPNSWDYVAEDDCRVYNIPLTAVKGDFFIMNMTWSDSLTDDESEPYMEIKEQIIGFMNTLGGRLSELKFDDYVGCVAVHVTWLAERTDTVKDILNRVVRSSITVEGQSKMLSAEACQPAVDLYSCPVLDRYGPPGGLVGLCAMTCQLDGDSCGEDKKCCKNSCGGSACIEVGYLQKIVVSITIDTDYNEALGDPNSPQYQAYMNMMSTIDAAIRGYGLRGYKSVKVLGFKPSASGLMTRRKRQAMPRKLVVQLEVRFTEEIPVEDMFMFKDDIMTNGFNVLGTTYYPLDVTFGSEDCESNPCAPGSFCVTRIGETSQCACPKSRTGASCNLRNCNVDGTSLCQNGAKCLYSNLNMDMYCDCPELFYGEFCEVSMCDYVKPGTCNSGTCVGDLTDWQLCDCPTGRGGLMCETTVPDEEMSDCERHSRLMKYALAVITGDVSDDKMTVPMSEFLHMVEQRALMVPNCWPRDSYTAGEYHSICLYDIDSGDRLTCFCTNKEGDEISQNYNYTTGMCGGGLSPGECPPEWGSDCKQPAWWCSEQVQCVPGREKCSLSPHCDSEMCSVAPQYVCVPKDQQLPCDPRPCKDDPNSMCMPCGSHGYCVDLGSDDMNMDDDKNYMCRCMTGYSGSDCEVSDSICSMIPKDLCETSCVGDIGSGNLCRCPPGYGGILCDKPARTSCERRRALYSDALAILRGEMSIEGYEMSDIQELIKMVVMVEGGDSIPAFSCTESGFYDKVQCTVLLSDLKTQYCQCVDHNGNFINSNTEAHINYDVCTAPTDFRQMGTMICGLPEYYAGLGIQLELCQNGGECVFDLYDGKVCECPEGYSGQFCEQRGEQDERRSFCEFMADAWDISHELFSGQPSWIASEIQKQTYLNVTYGFLTPTGIGSMALKAECQADGTFKPAVCYYNVTDGTKGPCYCWGLSGPILGREVDGPDSTECSEIIQTQCSQLEMCPGLRCEFGYKQNLMGCPICACSNPCETMKCDKGHRCVVNRMKDCDEDDDMKCARAMCVPKEKPGACPGYDDATIKVMSSIPGGGLAMLASEAESCPVTCFDDSDCEGEKKCCGLCGSKCVDPEDMYSCYDDQMRMKDQLQFLLKVREEMVGTTNLTRASMRLLERISDAEVIWVPECHSNGYLYAPLQCVYTLDSALNKDGTPVSCFCVDRLGNRVPGATANFFAPESCNVKPFSCPFVEQPENSDDAPRCRDDLDCEGGNKCCSSGVDQSVCAKPVDEAKLSTTVDRLMSMLCEKDSDMCQGGSTCVGRWQQDGTACQCPSGRYGPFCQQTSVDVVPRTACERKVFARRVFLQETSTETKPVGIGELVRRDIMRKMEEMGTDYNMEGMTAIWYQCTESGAYAPMQCIHEVEEGMDVTGGDPTYCFCVDEDGMEILGTRMQAKDGRRPFCGDVTGYKTCPVGHAYHNANGEIVMGLQGCPDGYSSKRSTYGERYCCPTVEGLRDVCHLPMDVGMDCPKDMSGMQPGTRYYYDDEAEQCKSFTYKGCAGNRNSFSSMEACLMRCKEKVHPGTCPSTPLKIAAQGDCADHCSEDDDCDEDYKCCASTCGQRCIPMGDDASAEKRCPVGQPRESVAGGACNKNKPCGAGYTCVNPGGNENAGGFCCPDYENVDLCTIPPTLTDRCRDPAERYFFNATSQMCEKFLFSGCSADFNNFMSIEDCCGACNGQGRCKMGKCPMVKPGLVSTCRSECSADAQCPGKKICCSNGCGNICVVPEVEQVSDCLSRQMEAKRTKNLKASDDSCDLVNMPMCEKDGSWSRVQCQTALGICWCVTPSSFYIDNSITRAVPKCGTDGDVRRAEVSKMDVADVNFPVCPGGEDVHCCPEALCHKKCPAHPDAMCRINPCGGCKAEYYSSSGMKVDCEEGLSMCEKELKEAATAIQEHQMTAAMAKGKEMDEMDDAMEKYKEKMAEKESAMAWIVSDRYPGRCLLPPDPSMCEGFMPQWYFNPAHGKCDLFIWGMCGGNDNRFSTPEDCYKACDPEAHPCMNFTCPDAKPVCEIQYDEMCYMSEGGCQVSAVCTERDDTHMVMDIFVPRCLSTGEYHYKQCHDDYCWCVDSNGQYVAGLTRENTNILTCDAGGVVDGFTESAACPNGQPPNPACMKACTGKTCPGQPMARCVADLCSADCSTKFVDMNGADVECTGDKCSVFTFEEIEDDDQCAAKLPCQGSQVKNCPETVCEKAKMLNCSRNPCAICKVDPCTCSPYFVDVNTKARLTNAQCQYLSLGACEVKKCSVLSEIEKAMFNKIDLANAEADIPECDAAGKFKASQCQGSKCQCVDEFGAPAQANSDGSCKEIDKIKRIKVTFTFKADFNKFKNDKKLSLLKDEIMKKLQENGIDPRIISIGEPYAGSIKVDVTFEENANSVNKDMAVIDNVLEQMTKTGDLNLNVDDETVPFEGATKQAQTASQVAEEDEEEEKKKDDDGLDTTEIVIIACVCGGVGLIIIVVIVYCVCCRKRNQKDPVDDTYDHVRAGSDPPFNKTVPTFNNYAYMEDDKFIKVKL